MTPRSPLRSTDIDTKQCPDCGSTEIRTSLSLYNTAKNYARSSLSRVAMTGGAGFYLDGVNVRATPETLMAAKFAPPEKPQFSWWLSLLTLVCAAFLYFCLTEFARLSIWLALVISLGCIAGDHFIRQLILRKKMTRYRDEYAEWEKIRVCMDCGNPLAF
ncbi:MAG TPA: hypothetical protein VGO50_20585 [Pyrinomonadaceae bacterium]|nr:hypothetical protein [Pyrinomonadaceae bacterium]